MRYSIIEGHDTPYAEVMTEKEFLADYGEFSLSLSLLRFEEKVRTLQSRYIRKDPSTEACPFHLKKEGNCLDGFIWMISGFYL